MKAGEHGPDELYDKFTVVKTKDVVPYVNKEWKEFPTSKELSGKDEFIFVLRPETDKAAIEALSLYGFLIRESYPNLSRQILLQLERIKNGK